MNPQITIKPQRTSITVAPRETTIVPVEQQQPAILVGSAETTIVQVSKQGPAGASGSSGASYERTFTQADLSLAGILPVTHGLNSFPSGVTVWNGSGEAIGADRVEVLTLDTIAVDLSSFTPLQGTFMISITT